MGRGLGTYNHNVSYTAALFEDWIELCHDAFMFETFTSTSGDHLIELCGCIMEYSAVYARIQEALRPAFDLSKLVNSIFVGPFWCGEPVVTY